MNYQYHQSDVIDYERRVVIVTGATGAIGKAIARQLAAKDDHTVVVVCRNEKKGRDAVNEIRVVSGNQHVFYELADLSRLASVLALTRRWPGKLDVLVNNAAITPRRRLETPEGLEMQWATNVMGYFWMTQSFAEMLQQSAPARVINVASYWAGDLDLTDLEFVRRRYDNNTAYRQSKQANRMLTTAFARRLDPRQITVNACHPGDVSSALSSELGFGGSETADEGAKTPVWLAVDDTGARESGKYFEHRREVRCRFAANAPAVEALYNACLRY